MSDYLMKALAYDGHVRAFAVCATQTVAEAQRRHDTWSAATAALGCTMVGAILLGFNLKGAEKLTVTVDGDGLGGKIVVDSDGNGHVRGFIQNPQVSLPLNEHGKLDVRRVVGQQGTLTVRKDLGLKEPFSGQVPLVSGELGEDFTYYMAVSEQTPSAIGVSVLVDTDDSVRTAGGFMIQVMPNAPEEVIAQLEQQIAACPAISDLMDAGHRPEAILTTLLGLDNVRILEQAPVCFFCPYDRAFFERGLLALGSNELRVMRDEDHQAEVVCHYCQDHFVFNEADLTQLIAEARSSGH